jgi:hypothetical protein
VIRLCWLLRSGDPLDPERTIGDAPLLDEATKSVVWDESEVGQWGPSNRAGGVAGGDPGFNTGAVIGLAGADRDRVPHELEGDGAAEVPWDLKVGEI